MGVAKKRVEKKRVGRNRTRPACAHNKHGRCTNFALRKNMYCGSCRKGAKKENKVVAAAQRDGVSHKPRVFNEDATEEDARLNVYTTCTTVHH
jgi:hypothetical protein